MDTQSIKNKIVKKLIYQKRPGLIFGPFLHLNNFIVKNKKITSFKKKGSTMKLNKLLIILFLTLSQPLFADLPPEWMTIGQNRINEFTNQAFIDVLNLLTPESKIVAGLLLFPDINDIVFYSTATAAIADLTQQEIDDGVVWIDKVRTALPTTFADPIITLCNELKALCDDNLTTPTARAFILSMQVNGFLVNDHFANIQEAGQGLQIIFDTINNDVDSKEGIHILITKCYRAVIKTACDLACGLAFLDT